LFSSNMHCIGSKLPSAVRLCQRLCIQPLSGAAQAPQPIVKAVLPDLPYDYSALEPVISADIMRLHHQKHHATYVNNFNSAQETLAAALAAGKASDIIAVQAALRFNGGGHVNHSIFWKNLSPQGGGEPSQFLLEAVNRDFGSFSKFQEQMSAAAVGVQGSGWAWLGYNFKTDRLQIATCANQDPLKATTGLEPLLGIDVWEHAYYLQYKNVRPDYVKSIWKVINWDDVENRLDQAKSGGVKLA
ncbi:hypothetical protein BOX15_Mlig028734g3, partial [Macrostomum lignano]|uniref:Superoxide dismutase n=2 Tax=Macrostomum lignano TaxID=282301 RepID=A0A1I8JBF2_9PLAT